MPEPTFARRIGAAAADVYGYAETPIRQGLVCHSVATLSVLSLDRTKLPQLEMLARDVDKIVLEKYHGRHGVAACTMSVVALSVMGCQPFYAASLEADDPKRAGRLINALFAFEISSSYLNLHRPRELPNQMYRYCTYMADVLDWKRANAEDVVKATVIAMQLYCDAYIRRGMFYDHVFVGPRRLSDSP